MKVSGKLSYKSAIIVNDVFFKDIDELLREYFEKPKYSAQLINGDEVEFESVSELISYDNFSNRAIKTMRIGFGIGNYIRIEPSMAFINGYKSTLEMGFEVENMVLCQDLVQVKMRFSSSQPASCNSSC